MKAYLAGALLALAFPRAAIAQVAVLQIHVLEGEGAVHQAGARVSRPLTVSVTDETGRPVEGATVSFRLPDEGPGGTFGGGLRSDIAISDNRGRASMRAFQVNRIPGQFEIRIGVVKEQVRAGMVSFQYVSDAKPVRAARAGRWRRWRTVLLLAAGAAAGGAAAATLGGSAGAAAAPPAPPSVGPPLIWVGTP